MNSISGKIQVFDLWPKMLLTNQTEDSLELNMSKKK